MRAISKVLIRTIVKEFYKENAGFLLIVMGLGFGFLKTPQHVDIASALALQPIYYLVPMVLWILYALKTINFIYRVKRLPQNWFLTDVNALKAAKLKAHAIYIEILLLAPILSYALFMTFIAVDLGQITSTIILIVANFLILMVSAHFFYQRLIQPIDSSISTSFKSWTRFLPKSFSFLLIHHLAYRHGTTFVLTKLFSIAIILGATSLFNIEGVDLRLLALGILLSSAINANFSFKYIEFESTSLSLYRNLPVSRLNMFGKSIITYIILSVPEFLVLFGNNLSQVNAFDLVKMAFLIPIISVLYQAIIKAQQINLEHFTKYAFFITSFLFFVILGYIDLLIINSILLMVAFILSTKKSHRIQTMGLQVKS